MVEFPRLDAYHFHERKWDSYENLMSEFEWEVPNEFNIADYVCDRWADDPGRVALFADSEDSGRRTLTFRDMERSANRLAHYLTELGIDRGDRIGLSGPQKAETALTYIAAWKVGAVPVPLSTKFGPEAIGYRLDDAGVKGVVIDEESIHPFREVKDDLGTLEFVLTVGDVVLEDGEGEFWEALRGRPDSFENADTAAEDDAVIIYTSGTTGEPKGVRHAHRFFLGHLPLFVFDICNMTIEESDVYWMPSEWSWIAVFDIIFPAWFYGRPALAYSATRFDPQKAFRLIDEYEVTNAFIPPTALRMMKGIESPARRYSLDSVRVIASGGEALDSSTYEWASDAFGNVAVHEGYGQTEANMLISNCSALGEVRPGRMGLAGPGHVIRILDPETGEPTVPRGEVGEIGVKYENDPVCFKEYWKKPEETGKKVQNGWVLTEDLARRDEDGYFSFVSRKDYVIISSGYRISPEEIEESLCTHNAVEQAGVVGIPDEKRGEVPKAYVQLSDGYDASDDLVSELQRLVKEYLAQYEYPREIEILDELPTTTTGKIQRERLEQRDK
ncbi:acyl-CoA synthetase [Halomarina halobia]|uniref:Acyl-CoA synthetase n=1 Tax=Halomarina halobia TaxID=3033386 RepID=A0ABD6AGL4_9EURY|nr:AMP-binding protein [Halomarina sp. PSR21]